MKKIFGELRILLSSEPYPKENLSASSSFYSYPVLKGLGLGLLLFVGWVCLIVFNTGG